ncbi:transmembrane protein [Shewanella sp. Sh95]|nr:transmembrane protein [Shewanella sp. Sh95]
MLLEHRPNLTSLSRVNVMLITCLGLMLFALAIAAIDPIIGQPTRLQVTVIDSTAENSLLALPDGRVTTLAQGGLTKNTQVTLCSRTHLVSGLEHFNLSPHQEAALSPEIQVLD